MAACPRTSTDKLKETVAAPVVSLRLLCGGVSTCSHGCCVAVCVGNRETIHTRSDCRLQPSPSALVNSVLSAPLFLLLPFPFSPCMPDCCLPYFILCVTDECVCASVTASPPFLILFHVSSHLFLLFNPHSYTNINCSSWELL